MAGVDGDWIDARYGKGKKPETAPVTPARQPPSPQSAPRPTLTPSDTIGHRAPMPPKADPGAAEKKADTSEVNKEELRTIIVVKEVEKVSFDDVKGLDEAVGEIREICDQLRFADVYKFFGAEMPRGMLLWGPPGTGKTMLVTAFVNTAEAAFLSVDCSGVMSKWVGGPERNISAIFDIAEEEAAKHPNKHAVLFLDEVESIIRSRDLDSHESSEKVLSIVLQRMNGLKKSGKVTVIAATNRPDKLDSAFVSRMNSVIECPLPDAAGRAAILKSRMEKRQSTARKALSLDAITFLGEVDYHGIAELLVAPGGQKVVSGREIDNLVNEIVSDKAKAVLALYRSREPSGAAQAPGEAGRHQLDIGKIQALAAEVGVVGTREVIATAKAFSKTRDLFEEGRTVDEYLAVLEEIKQKKEQAIPPSVHSPKFGLGPKTESEARDELIDDLKLRIEKGEKEVLRELYVNNGKMPEKVKGVVSSFLNDAIAKDEALTLIEALRADTGVVPPTLKS